MLIRCVRESLPSEDLPPWASERLKRFVRQSFAPDVSAEYVVLEIDFDEIPLVIVHHEHGYPIEAPLALFEIVDGRPSRHWTLRYADNVATFAPPDFHRPHFVDDVQESRDRELVTTYQRWRKMLEEEFPPFTRQA